MDHKSEKAIGFLCRCLAHLNNNTDQDWTLEIKLNSKEASIKFIDTRSLSPIEFSTGTYKKPDQIWGGLKYKNVLEELTSDIEAHFTYIVGLREVLKTVRMKNASLKKKGL